jgi:CHAD domain-containing protein
VQRRELMFRSAADPDEVFAALSTGYRVHAEPMSTGNWVCLDTIDWRLHRAGMTLRDTRHGRTAELVLSTGSGTPVTAPIRVRSWPRRVDMLPASELRDRLASTVGVRALLPLAEVRVRSTGLRLLDGEDKTRVRVRVDQQELASADRCRSLPLRVLVAPLRGYERDGQRCEDLLNRLIPRYPGNAMAATVALTEAGFVPGRPAVLPVELDPDAPCIESLTRLLINSMDVIDSVRTGVLDDIDIEYLHEMRTAVRATRSLLTLSGSILSGTEATRFTDEFAWLGKLTTPLRDLDVLLLELDGRGSVDLSGLSDHEIAPLREHLARRRRAALRALQTGLLCKRGTELSADWRASLHRFDTAQPGAKSTRSAAAEQAQLAYQRIVKAARPVTEETPADDLHRLRRRCKRMRYLLDGYRSVFAPRPLDDVRSALKRLQDCLGDIQDSDVQRARLASEAELFARKGAPIGTLLAMGALRDRTSRRDTAARGTLTRRLQAFCGPGMRSQVRALSVSGP